MDAFSIITSRRDIACHIDGFGAGDAVVVIQKDAVSAITTRYNIACHIDAVGARTVIQKDAVSAITTRRDIPSTSST